MHCGTGLLGPSIIVSGLPRIELEALSTTLSWLSIEQYLAGNVSCLIGENKTLSRSHIEKDKAVHRPLFIMSRERVCPLEPEKPILTETSLSSGPIFSVEGYPLLICFTREIARDWSTKCLSQYHEETPPSDACKTAKKKIKMRVS